MINSRILFTIVIALSCGSAFAENITDAFIKCINTDDDRKRLACYDKIGTDIAAANQPTKQQKKAPGSNYKKIDLLDLKVDIKDMANKKVAVTGVLGMVGDLAYLGTEEIDLSSVSVNIAKLPREDRKRILKDCAGYCNDVQINGTIHKDGLDTYEIVAEQIVWP